MSNTATTYGPYSPIMQRGSLYFISGQVGVDSSTKKAPLNIEEQTHLLFRNLIELLAQHDLNLCDIVKTTIFVTNIDDFSRVNDIYVEYFKDPRPARSCVEVAGLPKVSSNKVSLLIEMESIAYKEQK